MDDQKKRRPPLYVHKHERSHFEFGNRARSELIQELTPEIKRLAREGCRKPNDVSHALNRAGRRTALGLAWTPRLVSILLPMVFDRGGEGDRVWQRQPRLRPLPKKPLTRNADDVTPGLPPAQQTLRVNKSTQAPRQKRKKQGGGSSPNTQISKPRYPEVARLPYMKLPDTVEVWRRALRATVLGGPEGQKDAHAAIQAVQREWTRRAELADGYFKWPTTDAPLGDGTVLTHDWVDRGLLKFLDYSVGRTSGIRPEMRHAILSAVFKGDLPPYESRDYMADWGHPKTPKRLEKLANSIASFVRLAKRRQDPNLQDAIEEWEADLRFLYHTFYKAHFGWPKT